MLLPNQRFRTLSKRGVWLFVVFFPIGYLATFTIFTKYPFEYFLLTTLSLASLGVAIPVLLDRSWRSVLPVWVGLAAFLGPYYSEFYIAVIYPEMISYFPGVEVTISPRPEVYLTAYLVTTLGFAAFCCTARLYYSTRPRKWWKTIEHSFAKVRGQAPSINARALIWSALGLFTFNSMLVAQYNFVQGAPRESLLPGHFEGIVTYTQGLVLPTIMLGVVYAGISSNRMRLRNLGIAMIVGYAFWDTVLRASKGSIVNSVLLLFFLWLITGFRLKKREVGGGAALLLAAVLAFPIVMLYRGLRASSLSMADALQPSVLLETMASFFTSTDISVIVWQEILRVTGGGLLLALLEHQPVPLGFQALDFLDFSRGFTHYVTFEVFGAPLQFFYSFALAPSMLGFFYLIAGYSGVMCGVSLVTVGALAMWFRLGALGLRTAAVARTMWLWALFTAMTEGPMDEELFKILPVFLFAAMLTEWLARRSRRRYWVVSTPPLEPGRKYVVGRLSG